MRSARQVPNARVEQVVNAQFLVWGSGGGTTDNAQRATHLVLQTLEQEFLAYPRALSVLTIPFAPLHPLLLGQVPRIGPAPPLFGWLTLRLHGSHRPTIPADRRNARKA